MNNKWLRDAIFGLLCSGHHEDKWLQQNVPKHIPSDEQVAVAMAELSEKERFVLEKRSEEMTLIQVGKLLDVTRERVRQIEAKALRKLRHPLRKRILGLVK